MAPSQICKNNKMLFNLPPLSKSHDLIALIPQQKHETLRLSVFPLLKKNSFTGTFKDFAKISLTLSDI